MKNIFWAWCRSNRCDSGVALLKGGGSAASLGVLLMYLLLNCLALEAATTHVFDNLRTFGARLPAGDPDLTPQNTTDGPKDIAVSDLNGDGRPDIAVANKDGSVTVYFGHGAGGFDPALHLHTGADELRGIVCADLTGDGLKDIAVGAPYTNVVYLFVNQGGGVFGAPLQLPAWHGARDLAAGDFDGDGLIDLAVAGSTNGVSHWRSLGGGSFQVRTNFVMIGPINDHDFPQPAFYLKSFRPLGASRDELVVGRAQEQSVWVLGLDTNSNLAIQGILGNVHVNAFDTGPVLHPASSLLPDLVVAHNERGVLEVHAGNNLIGRFNPATNQVIQIDGGPRNVRIVDLDGDGWNDLVVVQQSFNKVTTFRNNFGVFEPFSQSAVGTGPREMDVGDFDGDGHPDVAVLNRQSSDVSILMTYPGAAGFKVPENVYEVGGDVSGLEVRDFNNDGLADVVQFHAAAAEFSVRLAQPDGTLGAPTYYPTTVQGAPSTRPLDRVIVDVNNDGIDDLISVDFRNYVSVRLGRADGTFGTATNIYLPDPVPTSGFMTYFQPMASTNTELFSIEAADFDGDGKLDLVVGFWDCRVGFFRGLGDGSFVFTRAHVLFPEPRGMVAGDFDGDGDLDFAVSSYYETWAVVENTGGLLTTSNLTKHIYSNGLRHVAEIKALDSNKDGDLDLLMIGGGGTKMFYGGPGVTFTMGGAGSIGASGLLLKDFDGDGNIDLVYGCSERSCVAAALGTSAGGYGPTNFFDVPASGFIATGDIDGDGLPDLVGSGEMLWVALSSRSYTNQAPVALSPPRALVDHPVINEFLALNSNRPLDADGGRMSDWIEIYNGATAPVSMAGWRLSLVRNDVSGIAETNIYGVTNQFTVTNTTVTTNFYDFPSTNLAGGGHLLLVCSDKIRSPLHTGFGLPSGGGLICLFDAAGVEKDRMQYGAQQANISCSRYRDGAASFVSCNIPTPGTANTDGGNIPPTVDFNGVDFDTIQPDTRLRFYARAQDDVAVMGVEVVWRRLDIPDTDHRTVLMDDGMNEDGAMLDGIYSGLLPYGFPAGASIQFYLECRDIDEQPTTTPSNPVFSGTGQTPNIYTLAIPLTKPPLEISEVVANNKTGYSDGTGRPDWIEIRNTSQEFISLAGISVAQNLFGKSDRFVFSNPSALAPGQHIVVSADAGTNSGALHAPFKINKDGDRIVLTGVDANGARILIDSVAFGPQVTDVALARLGAGGPWRKTTPTPGTGNITRPWEALVQTNGSITLGFPSVSGSSYVVQYRDDLIGGTWTSMAPIRGDGIEKAITEPIGNRRFYRVRQQQP